MIFKALVVFAALLALAAAQPPAREVAVTFDDLPVAGVGLRRDVPSSRELTAKLLKGIAAHRVPVIAFVNENKLASDDATQTAPDEARVALLSMWLDAGFALGNHSYSHADFNTTPLESFEADVLKGEAVPDATSRHALRGYRFITVERALEDPAYESPDTYTGTGGITWTHRWALTRRMGREFFAGEPEVPAFVAKAAQP
jgi:peptidoglycan/xylan/chitin deacetylase (PgdA/CDA1 family)